jgi:amino acid transporter
VPVLGLDALSSAAYGPEAALTLLLPMGVLGVARIVPITAVIIALLLVVYFSYRQTISAYPNGGGSYTVAKDNLHPRAALVVRRWYHRFLHNNRGALLRTLLRMRGGPRVIVVNTPFYLQD